MTYKTILSKEVRDDIRSWGLSRKLLLEIYDRLYVHLAANPHQYLRERIVPLAAYGYSFVLHDQIKFPYLHAFLFAVEIDEGNGKLIVVGCRHTTDASEDN